MCTDCTEEEEELEGEGWRMENVSAQEDKEDEGEEEKIGEVREEKEGDEEKGKEEERRTMVQWKKSKR